MPIGLYSDALVYDILHAEGTAREVGVLERIEARFGRGARAGLGAKTPRSRGTGSVWIEPACGTGRYLRVAERRGKVVIGFDRSPAMVEYARGRLGEKADLFVAEMTRFSRRVGRGRVDLAFNLINTIRHLGSDGAMLEHFAQVARVLRPRGVYVVGVSISDYGNEFEVEDVWHGRRGGMRVTQVVGFTPPPGRGRWERVISHVTVTVDGTEEHRDSRYRLRCYDLRQWEDLVQRSALRQVAVLDAAGRETVVKGAGYVLFVLRKR